MSPAAQFSRTQSLGIAVGQEDLDCRGCHLRMTLWINATGAAVAIRLDQATLSAAHGQILGFGHRL